jgi:hypothetical protein
MQHTSIVTNATRALVQTAVVASQGQVPQNTAVLINDGNLRVEPGRSTEVVRRLPAATRVEVIDRVTRAREDTPQRYDVWLKVRPTPTEVGWVLASLLEFDVPPEIAQHTENQIYSAVKVLTQVQDSEAGAMNWYLVGERRRAADPQLDFEGIRLFTWNGKKDRYETAFRTKLRGVYPLEVGQNEGKPTFRVHELKDDGTKVARDFVLNGVVVQETR